MSEPAGLDGRPFSEIKVTLLNRLEGDAHEARISADRAYPKYRAAYAEKARLLELAAAAIRPDAPAAIPARAVIDAYRAGSREAKLAAKFPAPAGATVTREQIKTAWIASGITRYATAFGIVEGQSWQTDGERKVRFLAALGVTVTDTPTEVPKAVKKVRAPDEPARSMDDWVKNGGTFVFDLRNRPTDTPSEGGVR